MANKGPNELLIVICTHYLIDQQQIRLTNYLSLYTTMFHSLIDFSLLFLSISLSISKQVESYYPQEVRVRPAPIPGLSCKRCDMAGTTTRGQMHNPSSSWGLDLATFGRGRDFSYSSPIGTRSGARSPRVTALNGRW